MLVFVGLAVARLSAAPCVVGSTEFDVPSTLCDINLTNDENGWFSSDLSGKIEALKKNGMGKKETVCFAKFPQP